MTALANSVVTSFDALESTIRIDYKVYGWFAYLIRQPTIKERLSEEEGIRQFYHELDRTVLKQAVVYALLWGLLMAFLLMGSYFLIAAGSVVLAVGVYLHLKKKEIVIKICARLFTQDFQELFLSTKTLYQIGELYGQKYQISSLVDTITFSDKIRRTVFTVALFAACFIYPLNPVYICLFVIISSYMARIVINTSFIYKHIR